MKISSALLATSVALSLISCSKEKLSHKNVVGVERTSSRFEDASAESADTVAALETEGETESSPLEESAVPPVSAPSVFEESRPKDNVILYVPKPCELAYLYFYETCGLTGAEWIRPATSRQTNTGIVMQVASRTELPDYGDVSVDIVRGWSGIFISGANQFVTADFMNAQGGKLSLYVGPNPYSFIGSWQYTKSITGFSYNPEGNHLKLRITKDAAIVFFNGKEVLRTDASITAGPKRVGIGSASTNAFVILDWYENFKIEKAD